MRRSKANLKKEIGACAKLIKSPIVLLERLQIGANGAILVEGAAQTVKKIKRSQLRNSSNIILSKVENGNTKKHEPNKNETSVSQSDEKKDLQSSGSTENAIVQQSTVTDLDHGVVLPATKSYKFKKKLKRLQEVPANKVSKTRSGNKLNNKESVISDEKLSEKDTITQKPSINKTVTDKKKISHNLKADGDKKFTDNAKQDDSTNSSQEQIGNGTCATGEGLHNQELLSDKRSIEETLPENKLVKTRQSSFRKKEVDDSKKSSLEIPSSNDTSMKNDCQSISTEKSTESVNTTTDASSHISVKNAIKTRSNVHDVTVTDNNSESLSKSKFTPKQISHKSLLNKKVLKNEAKEISPADARNDKQVKESISTRSKVLDEKKTCDKSFVENGITQSTQKDLESFSEIQTNSKSLSPTKTAVKSTIFIKSKLQGKEKIDDDEHLKTKQPVIVNKSAELMQTTSIAEEVPDDSKANTNSLKIKEIKIVKTKISTRSNLLEKNKVNNGKIVNEVQSSLTSNPSEIKNDNESSINGTVPSTKEIINERRKVSTRTSTKQETHLDQNHSTSQPSPVEITEQPLPKDAVQSSQKLSADLPTTKETTLNRSKLPVNKKKADLEKSDIEIEKSAVDQTQLVPPEVQINNKSLVDGQILLTEATKVTKNVDVEKTIPTQSEVVEENGRDKQESAYVDMPLLETDDSTPNLSEAEISIKIKDSEKSLASPKRIANSSMDPKKIDVKRTIATRSKLLDNNKSENLDKSVVENNAVGVEHNDSTLNSSQAKIGDVSTLNVNDSINTISTRSGIKTRVDIKRRERKKKTPVENQQSTSNSQARDESTTKQKADICLELDNQTDSQNINKQQQVCYKKEIVIKLFRCDQVQPVNNISKEKKATKKKTLQGKRKGVDESRIEPEAKKLKQTDFNGADLPAPSENQELVGNNQASLNAIENIDNSIVVSELPSHVGSNVSGVTESASENCTVTGKDSCLEENMDCITESPEITDKNNQCDNEAVQNGTELIVNSSSDNASVHEEEMPEDRDEGISVDTSENEANTEININNVDAINEEITSAADVQNKGSHNLSARALVEEVINDWADDDKTDNNDSAGVNEDLSTPEVIQIDDNEDEVDIIVDLHEKTVNNDIGEDQTRRSSHNVISTPKENAEPHSIEKTAEKSAEDKECNSTEKETRESNASPEHTSEVSEAEDVDVDDSNFESVDENSCAEIFITENGNDEEDNMPQETITYYNSEDICMDVGVSSNSNQLNDVVMNLKDACDKITADLNGVDDSYENNDPLNHCEPELLCISDDSDVDVEEEEEDEVMIIEPSREIQQSPQPPVLKQQTFVMSNRQLRQVIQRGNPSISVIKASELRDQIMEPPMEYPIKPSGMPTVVFPQRKMLSTTLLPANFTSNRQNDNSPMFSKHDNSTTLLPANFTSDRQNDNSPIFTEETIMKCPKCKIEFVGKSRLRRHWLTCGDALYLFCPFCPTKVKQRRSLIFHINKHHANKINQEEVVKVVERIVKQTREAAGVKPVASKYVPLTAIIRDAPNISKTPTIELPPYIRIHCVVCNKSYDEIPATYKKTCDDCASDLMTAICDLCHKQNMLSTKMAVHVQGNCIFNGRIKCNDCDFISSSRYHLQEHIIRKHIYVPPEDYVICRLGCGKAFRIQDALRKHERICGKEADLTCRFCDYKTKHRSAMKMHMQQHIVHQKLTVGTDGNIEVFGQQEGSEKSGTDEEVRDLTTEQQVRSVIRVHCTRCNRTLRLTSNRSSCEYCKLSFTFSCSRCSDSHRLDSLHAARLHVIRSHSVKIHECPHCGEKFSYVYDLTRHASKCKANTISCDLCSYMTNQESKLRVHKRRIHFTDSDESPVCKKCGKLFARGDSLRRHMRDNCGREPNMSCEHCSFKTKTKFSLLRHIQSQHAYIYENFSFVCDRCNKFYTNMFAYEVHVKNCHALCKN